MIPMRKVSLTAGNDSNGNKIIPVFPCISLHENEANLVCYIGLSFQF